MTTPHNSPAGDVQPIPVKLTEVSAEVQLGQAPAPVRKRRVVTSWTTVILTATNPVQPVLPADPSRKSASIYVRNQTGGGGSNNTFGWLADSKAAATQAGATQAGGYYITTANSGMGPIPVEGQNAVWAALDATQTGTAMVISVSADYYED